MTRLAVGEPELGRLSSGVEHSKGETRNLGELFKEAQKRNRRASPTKIKKKSKYEKPKSSGIYRVSRNRGLTYKQKFFFKFIYDKENGKKGSIQRRTLKELYSAVLNLGYDFKIINKEDAIAFLNRNCNKADFEFFCVELCLTENMGVLT